MKQNYYLIFGHNLIDMSDLRKTYDGDFSYPDPEDEDFQMKIYNKREFYGNRTTESLKVDTYQDLKKYRDNVCTGKIKNLLPQQSQLATFITPDTPYRGALAFWKPGKGKTCGAVATIEGFKDMVLKYGTKIHILVPGRLTKGIWKDEIINCTKDTYLKDYSQQLGYVSEEDREAAMKQARNNFSQFYKIMSHVAFYKRVLGQRIVEHVKNTESDKMDKVYKKNTQGEYERDIAGEKIDSLDNSILVIDEAHRIVGNEYGAAVKSIIEKSKNLRVLLLTGTPMKNLADDIIELINYIRPPNSQIDKDLVFTSHKNHTMDYKPGGREYLARMVSGYVSYVGGEDLYLYAKQIDMGSVHKDLMFTYVSECEMEKFQQDSYIDTVENFDDTLDRKSTAVSNFAFPIYSAEENKIIAGYGIEGLNNMIQSVKIYKEKHFQALKTFGVTGNNLVTIDEKNKTIGGDILALSNLRNFSTKFARCMDILNEMINEKSGLSFIFSNFVKIGIELFEQVLLSNGYLEYDPTGMYTIKPNTIHYKTGQIYEEFIKTNPASDFFPATFLSVTSGSEDESQVPEEKKHIIDNIFSNVSNTEGKFIKVLLGSPVMTEGVTLRNIKSIIILDTHYHLGQIMQVIGRGIRFCVHNDITSEENPYPEVKVYKLIVKIRGSNELSTEGVLYKKAEQKYILVKDVERVLQDNAFDCANNYNINAPKNMEEYNDCIPPLEYAALKDKTGYTQCPMSCNFQKCMFKCNNKKLNLKYYDENSKLYKKIKKANLDFTTFTSKMARTEINYCKEKIKEMFRFKYAYYLDEVLAYVRDSLSADQSDLFEVFFCYKALDEFILTSENEFNNYHDAIYDKLNVPGYLIYRGKFYIFQPLNQNENVPMYYRTTYAKTLLEELTMNQYFRNSLDSKITEEIDVLTEIVQEEYNFDDAMEYYNTRQEAKYVGIIDKPVARKKTIKSNLEDVFKIRERKKRNLSKKRGTGIPTLKGSVCSTSKDKDYLNKIAKAIGLTKFKDDTRLDICEAIRLRMLYLEKYSTTAQQNKITWVIIPKNHPKYNFPLNLEDRINEIILQLSEKVNAKVSTVESENGIFEDVRDKSFKKYNLSFKMKPEWNMHNDFFIDLGFTLNANTWTKTVE